MGADAPYRTIPCSSRGCGVPIYRNRIGRTVNADGTPHFCPVPDLPVVRECACGFVVVQDAPDGRKRLWPDGPNHRPHPLVDPRSADWERQEKARERWYADEVKRGGVLVDRDTPEMPPVTAQEAPQRPKDADPVPVPEGADAIAFAAPTPRPTPTATRPTPRSGGIL